MKVVEKDKLIHGMLQEELERCRRMASSLERKLSELPKGSLHVRKKSASVGKSNTFRVHKSTSPSSKAGGGKEAHKEPRGYSYHYLKYREGEKSISKHIPKDQVEELMGKLDARKNYERELETIRTRIRYLEKILQVGKK